MAGMMNQNAYVSPYMMSALMGNGGGYGGAEPTVHAPNLVADFMQGEMMKRQQEAQDQEIQERNNQEQLQKFEIMQAQYKQTYQNGMDAYWSKDPEQQRQFAKNNPAVWSQVQADGDTLQTERDIKNSADLKERVGQLTYDQYQTPEVQDRISQLMGTKAPQFKTEGDFDKWQMQVSGYLDKLTGNYGTLYRLQTIYAKTHDPAIKGMIGQFQAKDMMDLEKQRLGLVKQQQDINKAKRPSFDFSDAFFTAKGLVDNDSVLKTLAGDTADPNNPKGVVAGPRTAAATQIAHIARQLYNKYDGLDAERASEHAVSIYKFKTTVPIDKQTAALQLLWQHKDDPVYRQSFEKNTHIPADAVIEYLGTMANGQQ